MVPALRLASARPRNPVDPVLEHTRALWGGPRNTAQPGNPRELLKNTQAQVPPRDSDLIGPGLSPGDASPAAKQEPDKDPPAQQGRMETGGTELQGR